MTDVKLDQLDGTYLILEGRVVKAVTSDLMLDDPARRGGSTPPFRRALVHDQGDGLTLNYNADYPGGLRLVGVTEIIPKATGVFSHAHPTVAIRGGLSYEAQAVSVGGGATRVTVNLDDELAKLQARVTALEAKVK